MVYCKQCRAESRSKRHIHEHFHGIKNLGAFSDLCWPMIFTVLHSFMLKVICDVKYSLH
ncbi:unnamed protein product [Brassica rapa]|uniref:Uncharacterized protein n=1 Tax=Brassica campestris TaxID=3711 RepID=A0A3P6CXI1_BRACM|nr:unnamed protein product [Brassica rapa]VDD13112.1 unnamed protein product [Brassica rapa]